MAQQKDQLDQQPSKNRSRQAQDEHDDDVEVRIVFHSRVVGSRANAP